MNVPRKLDYDFSIIVRTLAGFTCEKCFTYYPNGKGLECSHFFGRRIKSTRFELDNCDAFCRECHEYFETHFGRYVIWKKKKLGPERYEALRDKKQKFTKVNKAYVQAVSDFIREEEGKLVNC